MACALTVVATVKRGSEAMLDSVLETTAKGINNGRPAPFPRATTHFARWVVLPPAADGGAQLLVLESNHDGSPDGWLTELLSAQGPLVDAVYGSCEGWPEAGSTDLPGALAYLRARARPAAAFYCAYPGHSVQGVANDRRVRELAAAFLDGLGERALELTASELRARVREHLVAAQAREPGLSIDPEPGPPTRGSARRLLALGGALVGGVLVGLATLPVLLPWLASVAIRLRRREQRDQPDVYTQPVRFSQRLAHEEDWHTQNQLTHLCRIKPGRFRRMVLRLVLGAVALIARLRDNVGDLGGIPSIHFARWVILDDGRLLFMSNFDGSLDSYLGDFIDRAASGLTAIWTNTDGFPRTRWLVLAGARDEEAFKNWTRKHQLHTQVWYTSCPDASVSNVQSDAAIRRGVGAGAALGEAESQAWLRLL